MAGRGLQCRAGKAYAPARHLQSCLADLSIAPGPVIVVVVMLSWQWESCSSVCGCTATVFEIKCAAKHKYVTGSAVVIHIL